MATKHCNCTLCMPAVRQNPVPKGKWWDRKPGYWRDELRVVSKPLTDREFLSHICGHTGKRSNSECKGWNRKAWSWHEEWKRDNAQQ